MKTINLNLIIKNLLLCMTLLCSLSAVCYGQYQIVDYDFPLPGVDFGKAVIGRIEGGFAVAGYSYSYPPGLSPRGYDWMMIKLNSDATVERSKLIGFGRDSFNTEVCYSLVQLSRDSGYVLTGFMTNLNNKSKATLVKVSKNLGISYRKRVNDTLRHQFRQVIKGPGDTLVFAGFSEPNVSIGGALHNKVLVARYTPEGTRLWIYKYEPQGFSGNVEEAYSVCYQPSDNSYAVLARYGSQGILILKLNRLGQIISERTFSFPNVTNYVTHGKKIIPLSDGGFVMVGYTQAYDDIGMEMWVLRVESDLDVVWSGIYGSDGVYEEGHSIVLNADTLVFTGFTGRVNRDAIIAKISLAGGAVLWSKKFDMSNDDRAFDIINTSADGLTGYTIAGHTNRLGGTPPNALLIQANLSGVVPGTDCLINYDLPYEEHIPVIATPTHYRQTKYDSSWSPSGRQPLVTSAVLCSDGDFVLGNQNNTMNSAPLKFSLSQNYPNPFNPSTRISFSIPADGIVLLKVYDITGREVKTLINEYIQSGNHSFEFNAVDLPSGVYFYKLEANGFSDTKKMILMK